MPRSALAAFYMDVSAPSPSANSISSKYKPLPRLHQQNQGGLSRQPMSPRHQQPRNSRTLPTLTTAPKSPRSPGKRRISFLAYAVPIIRFTVGHQEHPYLNRITAPLIVTLIVAAAAAFVQWCWPTFWPDVSQRSLPFWSRVPRVSSVPFHFPRSWLLALYLAAPSASQRFAVSAAATDHTLSLRWA